MFPKNLIFQINTHPIQFFFEIPRSQYLQKSLNFWEKAMLWIFRTIRFLKCKINYLTIIYIIVPVAIFFVILRQQRIDILDGYKFAVLNLRTQWVWDKLDLDIKWLDRGWWIGTFSWTSIAQPPIRYSWRRFSDFIVNFEHISHLVLVFLLLTLSR